MHPLHPTSPIALATTPNPPDPPTSMLQQNKQQQRSNQHIVRCQFCSLTSLHSVQSPKQKHPPEQVPDTQAGAPRRHQQATRWEEGHVLNRCTVVQAHAALRARSHIPQLHSVVVPTCTQQQQQGQQTAAVQLWYQAEV
jgi:hypothetical protein